MHRFLKSVLILATAGLNIGAAGKPSSSTCARPIPRGQVFAVRDVTLDRRAFGNGTQIDQHLIMGCVVTNRADLKNVSVNYLVFSAIGVVAGQDGATLDTIAPSHFVGRKAPRYRADPAGSPHLAPGVVAAPYPEVLVFVVWVDAGIRHIERYLVPVTLVN